MRDINIHSGDLCDIPRYIARNPYAWPGGYDIVGVTSDGQLMCSQCIRDNYRSVMQETRYPDWDSGWRIVGWSTSDWIEEPELCCNCYREMCPYDIEEEE